MLFGLVKMYQAVKSHYLFYLKLILITDANSNTGNFVNYLKKIKKHLSIQRIAIFAISLENSVLKNLRENPIWANSIQNRHHRGSKNTSSSSNKSKHINRFEINK